MKRIEVTLRAMTPTQVSTVEGEMRRKRIEFDVVHDKVKRTSRYVVSVRNENDLPKLLRERVA